METSKEGTDVTFDKDAYDWYLERGSLGKITELTAGKFPPGMLSSRILRTTITGRPAARAII
jgi:hypothetical protein